MFTATKVTVVEAPPPVTKLKHVKYGEFFVFLNWKGFDETTVFKSLYSDPSEKNSFTNETLHYRFALLRSDSTWEGGASSSLLNESVRVLAKGTVITITI